MTVALSRWVRPVALLAALACVSSTARADEAIDDPVNVPVEGVATDAQVGRAVRAALTRRGWAVAAEKPGSMEGILTKNGAYVVRVAVKYEASEITIRHVNSEGLDYDSEDRTIHRSYNKWMRMLAREINVNLALFAGADPGERENPYEPALVPQVVPVLSEANAPPALADTPPPAESARAPVPPPAASDAAAGRTLRANAQMRAQAKSSAPIMATNAAPVPVTPKGPVRNGEGTWWYVKTPTGSGWVMEAELQ